MSNFNWETTFLDLFDRCLERYRSGDTNVDGYYDEADQKFLKSIGYKPIEFFDYVEDIGDGAEISPATAVMIAAVRRDYLATELDGKLSDHEIKPGELTPKDMPQPGRTEKVASGLGVAGTLSEYERSIRR